MAQHPLFVKFGELYRAKRFEDALGVLDRLIGALPNAPQLAWHRANCLEQLERFEEIPAELDRVLAGAPDYVPAIVKRVRYTPEGAGLEEGGSDPLEADLVARAEQAAAHAESELRRALRLQPDNVEALELLSGMLRYTDHGDLAAAQREAAELLDRAIELAPERIDLLETRANALRSAAGSGDVADPALLQRVLADYERCLALSGHHRYAVRMGMLLHELGRFDEAVDAFDLALAGMDDEDAMRAHVAELRLRSLEEARPPGLGDDGMAEPACLEVPPLALPEAEEARDAQGGASDAIDASGFAAGADAQGVIEREAVLEPEADAERLTEGAASTPPSAPDAAPLYAVPVDDHHGEPTQPDLVSLAPIATAGQAGAPAEALPTRPRPAAVDELLRVRPDDEPDSVFVKRCVQRIMDAAYPRAAQLEEVDAAQYPAYQRLYVERVGREIGPLGIEFIGDGEQAATHPGVRQQGLIRCFADEEGELVVLASALPSDRPDWQTYLSLRLSRQWQSAGSVECLSQFADGTQLWTCIEHDDPFTYGAPVELDLLPAGTPIADLVARHLARHAAYRASHPRNPPLIAHEVEGVELRWRAALRSRQDYRLSMGGVTEAELRALLGEQYDRLSHPVLDLLAQCLGAPV